MIFFVVPKDDVCFLSEETLINLDGSTTAFHWIITIFSLKVADLSIRFFMKH